MLPMVYTYGRPGGKTVFIQASFSAKGSKFIFKTYILTKYNTRQVNTKQIACNFCSTFY